MIEYDQLEKALKNLQQQFENYRAMDASLPRITQKAIAESVIQRFEICYDCLWKALKRHLSQALGLPNVPNSPKPTFRLANENQLLPSGMSQWLTYADLRIATSHDDSGEKAQQVLVNVSDFIDDATGLYQVMSGKS